MHREVTMRSSLTGGDLASAPFLARALPRAEDQALLEQSHRAVRTAMGRPEVSTSLKRNRYPRTPDHHGGCHRRRSPDTPR